MRSNLILLPAVIALGLAQARAGERIAVSVPALLDRDAPIAESVKRDCAVEARVGDEVFLRVSERFPEAEKTEHAIPAASGTTVLKITIIGALGAGGGAWSGPKAMTVRADVIRDAKTVANTTLKRQSSGGVFGGVSGTCAIMDRIAAALGRDVAAWLPAALLATRAPKEGTPAAAPDMPTERKE